MNKEPETYEELVRKKRCIDLTKFYELSHDDLEQIYTFLGNNSDGQIKCGISNITLIKGTDTEHAITIPARCISKEIDGILVSNTAFSIISHYSPSSSSGSSGGSSSNNNNNNNNNNNR